MSSSTLIPHFRQVSKQTLPKIIPSPLLAKSLTNTLPIFISKRALTSTALKGLSASTVMKNNNQLRQYSTPSLTIHNEKTNVNQAPALAVAAEQDEGMNDSASQKEKQEK
ncbi:hypothetical protein BGW39_002367, partial [Mortierella sp. 14UC]